MRGVQNLPCDQLELTLLSSLNFTIPEVRHGEDICSKQSGGLPIVWNATVPNQWRHGESPSQPQGQESGAPENCTQAKETLRFPVSFQKLLTWFHAREKVTFKRVPNVALQESTSIAIENALLVDQGCIQEMEKEKFLACLWHVGSRPADALSKVQLQAMLAPETSSITFQTAHMRYCFFGFTTVLKNPRESMCGVNIGVLRMGDDSGPIS